MKLKNRKDKTGKKPRGLDDEPLSAKQKIYLAALFAGAAACCTGIGISARRCSPDKNSNHVSTSISERGPASYIVQPLLSTIPKNEKVAKLKQIIDSAENNEFASENIVETANLSSDLHLKVMVELASILADMRMDGNDIYSAILSVEDPAPRGERRFKVKRGPTPAETSRLDKIFKIDLHAMFKRDCPDASPFAYSYRYEKDSNIIVMAFRFLNEQ